MVCVAAGKKVVAIWMENGMRLNKNGFIYILIRLKNKESLCVDLYHMKMNGYMKHMQVHQILTCQSKILKEPYLIIYNTVCLLMGH